MMLRILVPPLWSLVLLILGASLVIGPWPGALLRWFRLRINPANAKGITARPMMRTSLLPKVPTRALAPKTKNATQSVVLNPMLPPKADAGPQANTALFIQLAPVKPSSLHPAPFGNHVARFSDCASCGKTRKAQQPFAAVFSLWGLGRRVERLGSRFHRTIVSSDANFHAKCKE